MSDIDIAKLVNASRQDGPRTGGPMPINKEVLSGGTQSDPYHFFGTGKPASNNQYLTENMDLLNQYHMDGE